MRGEASPRAMQHRREFAAAFVPPVWQRDHAFSFIYLFFFYTPPSSPPSLHLSEGRRRLNGEMLIFLGMNSVRHDSALRSPTPHPFFFFFFSVFFSCGVAVTKGLGEAGSAALQPHLGGMRRGRPGLSPRLAARSIN